MVAKTGMSSSAPDTLTGWEWARTDPGAALAPSSLPRDLAWHPAAVPGTVAGAMRAAGLWDGVAALPLDDHDFWFRAAFAGSGRDTLRLEGLATIAEVWVNGERLLVSENMFLAHRLELSTLSRNDLHICFRSLSRWLAAKRGRARWRPRMIQPPTLRFARTTLLGRMPGWCPVVHPVGPWRPVTVAPIVPGRPLPSALALRTRIEDGDGLATIALVLEDEPGGPVRLCVGGAGTGLERTGPRAFAGTVRLARVRRWWPHTHGEPYLYPARLRIGEDEMVLAPLGFRTLAIDTGADGKGFTLRVNDDAVFCRGACWTTPDLVTLPGGRADYMPLLLAARDAGMNMIRVPGTMIYESDAFFEACDALGVMVWQDVMLSNFDYPMKDEDFRGMLAAEVAQVLARTQPRASLAVLCGGSEVMQQAAMFGQPRAAWQDGPHTSLIPEIAAILSPDVPYVVNSPCGGDWPFLPNQGVTHYYGVGCYQLPLTDARRAEVRFTSECLGFANVPSARTVAEVLPVSSTTDPRWKAGTPHDMGVAWDFEDIRDFYLRDLFDVDPAALRYEDFERYLDASRAVSCAVMEGVFAEWRRSGSVCAGGLVYQLSDIRPGAGWGVIDSLGRPKPAYHALRRAFRPRQLVITDEGLNGLHLHVLNETDQVLRARLTLLCLREGRTPIREARRAVEVGPRGAALIPGSALLPEFFDMAYAYRFGPPFHAVTAAWLAEPDTGALIADAVPFHPQAPARARGSGRARRPVAGGGRLDAVPQHPGTRAVRPCRGRELSCRGGLVPSAARAGAAYPPDPPRRRRAGAGRRGARAEPGQRRNLSEPPVTPLYIGGCFGWLHEPLPERRTRRAVVLCPPIGNEACNVHRPLVVLAEMLAREGLPTLRFDYPGTGDSILDDEAGTSRRLGPQHRRRRRVADARGRGGGGGAVRPARRRHACGPCRAEHRQSCGAGPAGARRHRARAACASWSSPRVPGTRCGRWRCRPRRTAGSRRTGSASRLPPSRTWRGSTCAGWPRAAASSRAADGARRDGIGTRARRPAEHAGHGGRAPPVPRASKRW